jgi:cardiolipin synthase A/B
MTVMLTSALTSPSSPVWITLVLVLADLSVKLAALGFIPQNRRPSSAMAWLLLVYLIPFLGLLLFFVLGSTTVDRTRRRIHHDVNELVHERFSSDVAPQTAGVEPKWLRTAITMSQKLGTLPCTWGNDAELCSDYVDSIAAMTAEVERAKRFVNIEYFIMAWDDVTAPFFEACARAVERGVTVRVLFDHLATRGIPGYKDMKEKFDEAGCVWHPMLPILPLKGRWRRPDLRNHRKILVVDGLVAITGSQNLVEPGYNKPKNHKAGREWRELTVRLTGPTVTKLNVVFATDWFVETHEMLDQEEFVLEEVSHSQGIACQVVPSGPGFSHENNLRLFNTMIYGAQRRLSITSPYFVPDESLLYAVTTAAQRGVETELFVSEEGDQFMVYHAQRSYYHVLLDAGVRIWLYPRPYILHSKHFSVDDDVAVIGSSNMDMRSFGLNFEVSTMCFGGDFVQNIRKVEDHYRSISRELTLDEWTNIPLKTRYVDNVMRLTSALQ